MLRACAPGFRYASALTPCCVCVPQDSRICGLEREVQLLEDKLFKSKEELGMDDSRRDLSIKDSPSIRDKQMRFEVRVGPTFVSWLLEVGVVMVLLSRVVLVV